jgi:hypothetical protein
MRLRGGERVTGYIELGYWDLAAASVLVLIDAVLSISFGLSVNGGGKAGHWGGVKVGH